MGEGCEKNVCSDPHGEEETVMDYLFSGGAKGWGRKRKSSPMAFGGKNISHLEGNISQGGKKRRKSGGGWHL